MSWRERATKVEEGSGGGSWRERATQVSGPAPNPQEETILGGLLTKRTAQNWVNTLPTVGALGVGALGTPLAPPWGTIGGAGLGAAGGKSLEGLLETYFDLPEKPKTRAEVYLDPVKEGLIAATGEGVGLNVAKAVRGSPYKVSGKDLEAIEAVSKAKPGEVVREAPRAEGLIDIGDSFFDAAPKANAEQIKQASKLMGGEATPAMLSDNRNVRFLEQQLSQRPTLAGEAIRRKYTPIQKGLEDTAESVGQMNSFSPYEAGTEAKKSLMGKISERLDPLKASYEEIAQSTRAAPIDEKMSGRAAGILSRQPIAKVPGTEANTLVTKYADMLSKAKDAESVGIIVSDAKAALREAQGPARAALQKVVSAGERLQRRGLITAAKSGAGDEGVDVARGLIKDIKGTNKGFRNLVEDIKGAGINVPTGTSPGDVIRGLDESHAERLAEKLFNLKNVEALEGLRRFDSEAFETLRQNRLNTIVQQSMTKGRIDPAKLTRNLQKLPKEAKEILVGKENVGKLGNMETVLNAFPEIVNPSGTARGLSWGNYLKPTQYVDEISDAMKLRALQTGKIPGLLTPVRGTQKALQSPALPPAILTGTGLIRSRQDR